MKTELANMHSSVPTAGPFSSLTLPPPPRARPSNGYRDHEHSPAREYERDYSPKRRRVDEEAQWREREVSLLKTLFLFDLRRELSLFL